jgi:hypothetical protein
MHTQGLSGGIIAVYPPKESTFKPADNIIIGAFLRVTLCTVCSCVSSCCQGLVVCLLRVRRSAAAPCLDSRTRACV